MSDHFLLKTACGCIHASMLVASYKSHRGNHMSIFVIAVQYTVTKVRRGEAHTCLTFMAFFLKCLVYPVNEINVL